MTLVLEQPKLHYTMRQNARTWGSRFQARFLEPGVVSYEDCGGDMEYLAKATIDRHAESFVGRPAIIKHSKVTPVTMNEKAVGYISRVWYNADDGWYWCEGVITSDEAKDKINEGWSVSCGYKVTATNERGGSYHNIPYRRELTAFEGEHLALVENPRYEGATIRLNSKTQKPMNLLKLFKKTAAAPAPEKSETKPEPEKRENAAPAEVQDLARETEIEIAEGKKVTVGELVDHYNAKSDTVEVSEDTPVEVAEGVQVPISALVARYNETEAAKRKENEKKDGTKSFRVLGTARLTASAAPSLDRANSSNSVEDGVARGKTRYGTAPGKN